MGATPIPIRLTLSLSKGEPVEGRAAHLPRYPAAMVRQALPKRRIGSGTRGSSTRLTLSLSKGEPVEGRAANLPPQRPPAPPNSVAVFCTVVFVPKPPICRGAAPSIGGRSARPGSRESGLIVQSATGGGDVDICAIVLPLPVPCPRTGRGSEGLAHSVAHRDHQSALLSYSDRRGRDAMGQQRHKSVADHQTACALFVCANRCRWRLRSAAPQTHRCKFMMRMIGLG